MAAVMKGAVATGHSLTTEAATRILQKGGNAFDAIVAAGFAATFTEGIFASLGGGGFILGHHYRERRDFCYDFFVNTPGTGNEGCSSPELQAMELHFSEASQVFYIGLSSIAVPGTLKGLAHCYHEHCSFDLDDLIAPVIEYLKKGIIVTPSQTNILNVVKPIFDLSDYGREIFVYESGKRMYNPLLLEFYQQRSLDSWLKTLYGSGAQSFLSDMKKGGGMVTGEDLENYQVIERTPLSVDYRGYQVVSNPAPSFGGPIICEALEMLSNQEFEGKDIKTKMLMRTEILQAINHLKGAGGTTHLNVIDKDNNAVGMSLSAGTGCGYFFPGTGILMNNTMGEEDLHPGAFYASKAGSRVPSMMAPTFIKKGGKVHASLGTGGSSRIRSAILQVILNLIDEKMGVQEAVEAPRLHFDEREVLQIEKGFSDEVLQLLKSTYPKHNAWTQKDLYFGGTHTVMGNLDGHGDSRRNGCYQVSE